MRFLRIGLVVAAATLAFACSSTGEDSAASGTALNQANDADGGPVAPLAAIDTTPLTLDGAGRLVSYSPAAPFNAFTLHATAGTKLRILVDARTPATKPEIFLTNAGFVTLASSSTGFGTAFVTYEVTAADAGTLYLVVREATMKPAKFLVSVRGETPPPVVEPPASEDAGAPPVEPPVKKDAGAPVDPEQP